MAKRKKASSSNNVPTTTTNQQQQPKKSKPSSSTTAERTNPSHRGIHTDAIVAGRAPTGAAACVACRTTIPKGHLRWGLKYAGNPLLVPVLPLYGSHPMVLWCHGGGCGLAYIRFRELEAEPPAVRTCHACQDAPDDAHHTAVRLLCGGPPKGRKIQHHVFHISCWIRSIQQSSDNNNDPSITESLLLKPSDIGGVGTTKKRTTSSSSSSSSSTLCGLSWDDLSSNEQKLVREEFETMGVAV